MKSVQPQKSNKLITRVGLSVLVTSAAFLGAGIAAQAEAQTGAVSQGSGVPDGPYEFAPPVFDIEAGPNGNLFVPMTVFPISEVPDEGATSTSTIAEIRQNGDIRQIAEVTTVEGSPVNGLAANGQGDFFVASGATDEAVGAGLWRVSWGGQRLVGDIEAFEVLNDPDLFAIGDWKDPACAAASGPFTPGPQSNPFRVTPVSGNTALVADAAGNTLLRVKGNREIEVVALFTPATADGTGSTDSEDWLEFPFDGGTPDDPSDDPTEGNCFVQPVPDAVTVADDGAIYVGELTGVGALGVSRVWRIEPGTTEAVCPSADCEVVFSGFTSIIDMAFGPDGDLFVVENDENGWLTSLGIGTPAGGTVNRCDLVTGTCSEELTGLTFPTAITFDKWGDAWLLENSLVAPTVSKLD